MKLILHQKLCVVSLRFHKPKMDLASVVYLVALMVAATYKFVPATPPMITYLWKVLNILNLVRQVWTHLSRLSTVLARLVLILMMVFLFSHLS